MFAEVYINTNVLSLDRAFGYRVPPKMAGDAVVGVRVKVPFGAGNKLSEGIIANLTDECTFEDVKDLKAVIDKFPSLTQKDIDLVMEMRRDYYCTFYQAARLLLPAGSEPKKEEWVSLKAGAGEDDVKKLSRSAQQEKLFILLMNSGTLEMEAIRAEMGKSARKTVNALCKKGLAEVAEKNISRVGEKTVRVARYIAQDDPKDVIDSLSRRSPAQARIVEFLQDGAAYAVSDIIKECKCSRNSLEALNINGIVAYEEASVLRNPHGEIGERTKPFDPTAEQRSAIDAVTGAEKGTFLIHGVTGSGKTEVYLQIVEEVLKRGKQAIVLVPEISLTPQITDRFYKRFGSVVAVMHSALSLGERYDEYKRLRLGEARVAVGARSAVFAPCRDLGIIIIDEEHEYSYKSETTPKYHAIEVAQKRCEAANCPLVLASATPSAESYYRAVKGEYTLIKLTERYNKYPLPEAEIADMREELRAGNRSVLSRTLARGMYENLKNGEQTILFLNRRGYSTFVSCRSCGFVYMCPNCSVSLTYHSANDTLNCHICGYRQRRDRLCPACGSDKIRDFGTGTQKAERQIQEIFPNAKIVRMDTDTTGGKNGHERILEEFENKGGDVLLGTQMVSKGLDFPNVTLVGALAADSSLYADDFRAQERTFALMTQVCGRAGRGDKAGRAVIQTYSPENRVLRLAAAQDYDTFFKEEIEYRRVFGYPPFEHIVNIVISGEDEREVEKCALSAAAQLKVSQAARDEEIKIFGPMDAPIKKMQGRYRKRIWFKCRAISLFSEVFREISAKKRGKGIAVSIDTDPYNMK